jgi:hypothetical protein
MILYQLTTSGEMDFPHIDAVSPWFELELHVGQPERLARATSPRILKTHLHPGDLPATGKKIYIVRDVRDVAVSAYHQHRLITGRDEDLGAFVELFVDGWNGYGSWYDHLEAWWPHRHDENILFLGFAEVIDDLERAAVRIAEFAGISVNRETLTRVRERCCFEAIKAHEEQFDPRFRRYAEERSSFIRRGRVGEGRVILDPERRCILGERLRYLGERLAWRPGDPRARLFQPEWENVEEGASDAVARGSSSADELQNAYHPAP